MSIDSIPSGPDVSRLVVVRAQERLEQEKARKAQEEEDKRREEEEQRRNGHTLQNYSNKFNFGQKC